MLLNLTQDNYPYIAYVPLRFGALLFSIVVYLSLIGWFIQSLMLKSRPKLLIFFLLLSHIIVFSELIVRATVDLHSTNRKTMFRIAGALTTVSPRLLLFANYHCLTLLRDKKPLKVFDRFIDIIIPITAMSADIFLNIANELSLKWKYIPLTFIFRQLSASIIIFLGLFFFFVWYFSVDLSRRHYFRILLSISGVCVLIEGIYVGLLSFSFVYAHLNTNEFYFYIGHLVPVTFALVTWTLFHPARNLPLPSNVSLPNDQTEHELL